MMQFENSAGALIYKMENNTIKMLFLIRFNDKLDIAKGHIEQGENSVIAAKREIKEETNLDVEFVPSFSASTRYRFIERYDGPSKKVSKQVNIYLAKTDGKDVKASEEHKGFCWLNEKDALARIKYRELSSILKRAFAYIPRYEAMLALNKEYAELPSKNAQWQLSSRLVPGAGALDAKVMLIGQAPGRNEDKLLAPFVGRSGVILNKMLAAAHLDRRNTYITSVVQFFPPENRLPTDEEQALCLPLLERQIALVKPKYIILLGKFATESLFGKGSDTTPGRMIEKNGIRYYVAVHPARALRLKAAYNGMMSQFKRFGKEVSTRAKSQGANSQRQNFSPRHRPLSSAYQRQEKQVHSAQP